MEFDVSFARSINRGEGGGERKRRTDGLRAVRSVQRASSLRIAITYAVLARFFFFFSVTRNYFNLSLPRKRVTFMVRVRTFWGERRFDDDFGPSGT